ncbi:hypothetical protein MSTO_28990 [Mycobacterium stomatepiae]|uniref:Uncharacterized protein n=1 Tax=Mycobacterium stomatepiae TaxID=470076 RepID=A0A7I7Q8P2_9MYCO|nr:hypothetical protein MSTO_28990 [Mycobacterium stomatepiae]
MLPKPKKGNKPGQVPATDPADGGKAPGAGYPVLCLRHLQPGWGFEEAAADQCQAFLIKWAKRASFTWTELVQHHKHGLGSEKIPRSKINPQIPPHLELDDYVVFRHQQNLPFVGFRSGDVFHVLWVEREYNELYQH